MRRREIVFHWENFGPYHDDRCQAAAAHFGDQWKILGVELSGASNSYGWCSNAATNFEKRTLLSGMASEEVPFRKRCIALLKECLSHLGAHFFFCHYQDPATFAVACILRLLGQNVFIMTDSKFDDYKRSLPRELLKVVLYMPYRGAMSAGRRTTDYLRFLGFTKRPIVGGYDTVSLDRIRTLAQAVPAPGGAAFSDRHFTIVARMVPKKNLAMSLEAYALYCKAVSQPRPLHLCGSGPLEAELKDKARALGIEDRVVFRGWLQTADICVTLASTLTLILASTEEQFGIVIVEAMGMGVPVIASENCGARDYLLKSGINGFVIEPDNPVGLAYFMTLLSQDEALWKRMAQSALARSPLGDVNEFVAGVAHLIGCDAADLHGKSMP